MRAHLLHVLLHLRALLRGEHVHDLPTQLLASLPARLWIGLAALRMRLAELLHDLLDLRLLLSAQIDAAEHPHEAAPAVMMALPLALALRRPRRRLACLLSKDRNGGCQCRAQRNGKKIRT